MNNSTMLAIEKIAEEIRTSINLCEAPYNPNIAVERLGGVIENDIVDDSIDAYVEKTDETSFVIHLNSTKPKERQNFSIAHEIGHLFLHMGYLINKEKWEKCESGCNSYMYRMDNNFSLKESEANEFAAAFLMPKGEFVSVAEQNLSDNYYSIPPISKYFCVSETAAINRGKWLGIFRW